MAAGEGVSMDSLKRRRYAILLTALVWVALIESFSHRRLLGPVLSDLVITTTMLLVFLIVFDRWVNRLVAFIALATAVVASWSHYLLPSSAELWLRLIYHSAALLLTGFAALVILRNIFEQRVVRAEDVLGAVCGYLLAAGAWSNLFMVIEIFLPGSFSVGPGFGAGLDTWDGRSRAELRQSRLFDERRLRYSGAGSPPGHHPDNARSSIRAILYCDRSRTIGRRAALSGTAAGVKKHAKHCAAKNACEHYQADYGTH